jgi:hypothetical protein
MEFPSRPENKTRNHALSSDSLFFVELEIEILFNSMPACGKSNSTPTEFSTLSHEKVVKEPFSSTYDFGHSCLRGAFFRVHLQPTPTIVGRA